MKILFIGLGSIGQRHLRNLSEINNTTQSLIAYRAKRITPLLTDDMKIDSINILSKKYNISEYNNLNRCFEENPEVAFITNPTSMHIDSAIECAKKGCSLFIEKPISNNMNRVSELVDLCHSKNLISFVGYQLRFDKGLNKIKTYLTNNEIGTILSAQFHQAEYLPAWHPYEDYRISYASRKDLGGGAVLTQIHEIDYLLWLFGQPSSLYCLGGKRSNLEIDVEDTASILFNFGSARSPIPVCLNLDYIQSPPRRGGVIVGEKGRIMWDYHTNSVDLIKPNKDECIYNNFGKRERNSLFIAELNHFFECIEKNVNSSIPIEEGAKSLKIALAAKESLASNEIIRFE